MIRILHVIGSMNRGGAETMIMNLYRNIDRNKIQFDFVVHVNDEGAYDDEIKSMGGKIYHCPKYNGKNYFQYKQWWNDFYKQHSEYGIIHGHLGSTVMIYLSISKKYNCFTIAHSHNTWGKFNLHKFIYYLYSYPTRYIADYFIGCSKEAGISRFGKKTAYNDSIFTVLNNAIDTEKFKFNEVARNKIRNELNIADKLVIGHVGRFNEQKNHVFLVEIFKEIIKLNSKVVLLLIGSGTLQSNINSIICNYGLEKNVIFLGQKSNVNDYLQAMDIFLFPSLYEGLSVAAIEAQASGLECFFSDTIDKKTAISNQVHFISLNESAVKWAELILSKYKVKNRADVINQIVMAGYDISKTSESIQKFYMEVSEKCMRK